MNCKVLISVFCIAVAAIAQNESKNQDWTIDNIKKAITGETTASAKYAAYAQKATEEKFDNIARLFEAASKAESIHAKNHTNELEAAGVKMDSIKPEFTVKTTKENLEDAVKGESYEVETMYPEFINKAKEEKKSNAVASFNYAFQVEKLHKELYTSALKALNDNSLKSLSNTYYVCQICGSTLSASAPAKCKICGASKDKFIIIK
jgi:rubrerythrin